MHRVLIQPYQICFSVDICIKNLHRWLVVFCFEYWDCYNDLLQITSKQDESEYRSLLEKCAVTALSSKLIHQQKGFFSKMVVDAVLHLDDLLPINMIGIKKVQGGSLEVYIFSFLLLHLIAKFVWSKITYNICILFNCIFSNVFLQTIYIEAIVQFVTYTVYLCHIFLI